MSVKNYIGKDLTVIVPTKDRPEKIRDFLSSLVQQSLPCGTIIIVNSGVSLGDVVDAFTDKLDIRCYDCTQPGQIRQRNMGISKLEDSSRLVAFFDDDIVLEKDAFEKMINFWNQVEAETAGIGFNLVNEPTHKYSFAKSLLGASGPKPGDILPSGFNTFIHGKSSSFRSKWLCGGATVWRHDVLKEFSHKEIDTVWAACEDIIFSYPIGKKYPLYICSEAIARHEHETNVQGQGNLQHFRGKMSVLWRLYFVRSNNDLSSKAFFWMTFSTSIAGCFIGIFKFDTNFFRLHFGRFTGGLIGLVALVQGKKIISLLTKV